MSRRLGKTHLMCAMADELCRKKPHARVKYASATKDSIRDYVRPVMRILLARCPPELRPVWNASRYAFEYPNGSEIKMAGCETSWAAGHLRGGACDLAIVDEGAIIPILPELIDSILMPTLLTTRGVMILASSAPSVPGHPFDDYCDLAEKNGALVVRDIYQATHIAPEDIEQACIDCGGPTSTTWQREYLCKTILSADKAVIPEWATAEVDVMTEPPLPAYYDRYVGIDQGFRDMSVAAFGYLDYHDQRVVVQAEVALSGKTTADLVQECKDTEQRLWGPAEPIIRVCDAPAQTIADMGATHNYAVSFPFKGDKHSSVVRLRDAVRDRKIAIYPACMTIRQHIRKAVWAPNGKDFDRIDPTESTPGHHFDGLDAVRYLVDAVDWHRDPKPDTFDPWTQQRYGAHGKPWKPPSLFGTRARR